MDISAIIHRTLQLTKENLEYYIELNLREVYGNEKFIIYLNNPNPGKNESQEQMIDFRDLENNYRKKFKDVSYFTNLFLKHWEGIFKPKLTNNYVLSLIHSIRHFRNRWAHQSNMNEREVYRLADEAQALLEEIRPNDGKGSERIEEMNDIRLDALEKLVFAEMDRHNVNNNNHDLNNGSETNPQSVQANKDNKFSKHAFQDLNVYNINYDNSNPNYNDANYNICNSANNYKVNAELNSHFSENNENYNLINSENQIYPNQNSEYNTNNNAFNSQFPIGAESNNANYNTNNLDYYSNHIPLNSNFANEIPSNIHDYNSSYHQNHSEPNNEKTQNVSSIIDSNQINNHNNRNINGKFNKKFNKQVAFEEDKPMQEYDKILMKNQHYDKIINQNLKKENNHFNVYVHSDDDN